LTVTIVRPGKSVSALAATWLKRRLRLVAASPKFATFWPELRFRALVITPAWRRGVGRASVITRGSVLLVRALLITSAWRRAVGGAFEITRRSVLLVRSLVITPAWRRAVGRASGITRELVLLVRALVITPAWRAVGRAFEIAGWSILLVPTFLAASLILRLTLVVELLARILMITPGSPAPTAGLLRHLRRASLLRILAGVPQLPARKILHLGVWMLLAQPIERRQQLFALGCPERGGQPGGEDGPVRVAGWHLAIPL
jgi:hypothetical protein